MPSLVTRNPFTGGAKKVTGKGRPQADPVGTRSALPATEAAGTLMGVGSGLRTPRVRRRTS